MDARQSVELVAGHYGDFVAVSSRAETLEQLNQMKRHGQEIERLVRVRPVGLFEAYVAANHDDGTAMVRSDRAFRQYEKMLAGLNAWTDRAMADLKKEHRSPKADPGNLDWLIGELDKILNLFTSWRISRSENKNNQSEKFVDLVVKSIPGHKATGVKEAIKRYAAKTRKD